MCLCTPHSRLWHSLCVKKKILMLALALTTLAGVAIGAYMLHDYHEHKPLILKCTVSESPKPNPYRVGGAYIWKFTAYQYGWSVRPDEGLGIANFWNTSEEDWSSYVSYARSSFLQADKNQFSWNDETTNPGRELKYKIDRNSGEFSVLAFDDNLGLWHECGKDPYPTCVVEERGSCIKSAEPAKTLKQKF
jgi:hypothetical protein